MKSNPTPLRSLRTALILFLIVAFAPAALRAQEARGRITGRVTDPTRGVLPGADVKVTDTQRNTTVSTVTNSEGMFTVNYRIPGTYLVTVEMQGFKKYIQDKIPLSMNETRNIAAILELGGAQETVTVLAEGAPINTNDGNMGLTLDAKRIAELPLQSVSTATAQTLPALIGVSRTPGTVILAGAVRDCAGNVMSNFIATVSSTEASLTSTVDVVKHLPGVDAYYFSASVGLRVRHSQQQHSSKNGLFMAIEMQPTATAYVQVWGYKNDADLAADKLSLIAQLESAVIADVVITGSYDPLRTH